MIEWKQAYDCLYKDKQNVEMLVEFFQLLIVETATQVFGFKKYCQDSVNWVDRKVHKILKKKKKISNKVSHLDSKFRKRYGSIANTPKYQRKILKKKKKKLRKLQKSLKKKKYKNILQSTSNIERLINNSGINQEKLFYNMVNKISNRQTHSIPPLRDVDTDEIIAQTDMEIANKLHDHYCTKLKRNKYKQRHRLFHNYVESVIENYEKNRNKENDIVNRKFTQQEVMHVLTAINVQSAMGYDYIHYQLLVWAKVVIIANLTLLFNLVFYIHQVCPKIWKFGEYVPVPKPGRAPYYCKNIRPISILPGLGRIIGKLHCNRLLTDCIKRKLLTKYNCAFQCNRGPDDIYNNLTESILQSLQNGHFFEMSFEDLKSAYDSVWIEGLIYRMINDYKYDGNIIAWYLSFFDDRYTRVKYNGKKTEWRKALKNLPQGQTDSTILFVIFLNNIDLLNIHNLAKKLKLCVQEDNLDNNDGNKKEYDIKSIFSKINEWTKNKVIGNEDKDIVKIKRPKFMNIATFNIVFMNFADDCALAMKPMKEMCELTKKIKFNYRWNLQGGINNFFEFTRFFHLVIAKSKCSTVSFSRKRFFRAYVYKLDGKSLDLIHSRTNGPQDCIHNEQTQYLNPFKTMEEGNGDSDLENLNNDGEKIICSGRMESTDPKNKIFRIKKSGKQGKRQEYSKNELPESVRILGVYFDPEMYFNEHIRIVTKKVRKNYIVY